MSDYCENCAGNGTCYECQQKEIAALRAEVERLTARERELERTLAKAYPAMEQMHRERDEARASLARVTEERDEARLEASANEWMAEAVRVTGRSYSQLNDTGDGAEFIREILRAATAAEVAAIDTADKARNRGAFAAASLPILRRMPSAIEAEVARLRAELERVSGCARYQICIRDDCTERIGPLRPSPAPSPAPCTVNVGCVLSPGHLGGCQFERINAAPIPKEDAAATLRRLGGTPPNPEAQQANLDANLAALGIPKEAAPREARCVCGHIDTVHRGERVGLALGSCAVPGCKCGLYRPFQPRLSASDGATPRQVIDAVAAGTMTPEDGAAKLESAAAIDESDLTPPTDLEGLAKVLTSMPRVDSLDHLLDAPDSATGGRCEACGGALLNGDPASCACHGTGRSPDTTPTKEK